MRGDRPTKLRFYLLRSAFTPHARGSTAIEVIIRARDAVYPACAGIDRAAYRAVADLDSLPRMRGDRPLIIRHRFRLSVFTPHARGSTF